MKRILHILKKENDYEISSRMIDIDEIIMIECIYPIENQSKEPGSNEEEAVNNITLIITFKNGSDINLEFLNNVVFKITESGKEIIKTTLLKEVESYISC
jgi:hypothetical protein